MSQKTRVALIITAVALVLPLVAVLAGQYAPLLAVLGIGIGVGVYVSRKAKQPQMLAAVPNPIGPNVYGGQFPSAVYSSRTQDVLPRETESQNWFMKKWLALWNNPNHAAMVLICALWIICPLDGDFLLGVGWLDDLAAMVLLGKHARDLFSFKWGKPPERMLAENAKGLVTELARDAASIPSAVSTQRLPAGSPR